MNATPHTVIGYSMIKLVGVNPLGCLFAFVSHLVLDYVDEKNGLKTAKERFVYDILPTILLALILFLLFGKSEVYDLFLGSFFGNLPDFIAKKGYFKYWYPTLQKVIPSLTNYLETFAKVQSFINWAMIPTSFLHWQKQIINPTPTQTKWMGYALILVAISTLLIIK
jgi:hypothetical protein